MDCGVRGGGAGRKSVKEDKEEKGEDGEVRRGGRGVDEDGREGEKNS